MNKNEHCFEKCDLGLANMNQVDPINWLITSTDVHCDNIVHSSSCAEILNSKLWSKLYFTKNN